MCIVGEHKMQSLYRTLLEVGEHKMQPPELDVGEHKMQPQEKKNAITIPNIA